MSLVVSGSCQTRLKGCSSKNETGLCGLVFGVLMEVLYGRLQSAPDSEKLLSAG